MAPPSRIPNGNRSSGERVVLAASNAHRPGLADEIYLTQFAKDPYSFWLDGGRDSTDGYNYLGSGHELISNRVGGTETDIASRFREAWRHDSAEAPAVGDFAPGWVGYIGYEWRARSEESGRVTDSIDVQPRHPSAAFVRVTRLVVIDHSSGAVSAVWRDDPDGDAWADDVLRLVGRLTNGAGSRHPEPSQHLVGEPSGATTWRSGRRDYARLVERCRDAIRRGDSYQLCLTNSITVPGRFNAVEAFRMLRRTSPTHRGGLLRFGEVSLVSASPEKFLGLDRSGRIEVKPIKGTRPRGADAEADDALAAELRSSAKERAENLMIVDLMRNDIGRVADAGSVRVDRLFDVESYAHVHQLVSTVSGQLAAGRDAIDVLAAVFPAGSMTGAPKESAIRTLRDLETEPRGLYAGAFGLVGADGALDLSMVIRSIVFDEHGASIGAGGGITWSSDAEAEVDEMVLKARALLQVLGSPLEPPE